MSVIKKYKAFNDTLLELHPELKDSLKPNDNYPELKLVRKIRPLNLPHGSLNTRVVINGGKIIERIYRTPTGQVVSFFSNSSSMLINQAA